MSGLDSIAVRARRGECFKDVLIIDAHAHLGASYMFPIANADGAGMLQSLDCLGVAVTCFSGIEAAVGVDFRAGNDAVAATVREFPGRFLGYCVVYPHRPEGVAPEVERCAALGLRALKIHSVHGMPYNASEYLPAYEFANAHGFPVLAHTWGNRELGPIRELAQQYRNITWLAAHAGSQDWNSYVRIARDLPNVYLELCSSICGRGWVERFVSEVGAAKILYGSDVPFISCTRQLGRVALADISEDDKRMILGLNAARIFKLPERLPAVGERTVHAH